MKFVYVIGNSGLRTREAQTENFVIDCPIQKVYEAVISAASEKKYKIQDANNTLYRVRVQSRTTFASIGANITVQLSPCESGTTVAVSSCEKNWFGSSYTDAGANRCNIDRQNINDFLDSVSKNI